MKKQEQKIHTHMLSHLLSYGKGGALISIISSAYVAWYFSLAMNINGFLYLWIIGIVLCNGIRYLISYRSEFVEDYRQLSFYFKQYAMVLFATGVLWGLLYPVYYHQMNYFQQFFVILLMIAGVTVSIISLSHSKLCFYLFAVPMVLPMWVVSLMRESIDDIFFNIGLTIYIVIIFYLYHVNYQRVFSNMSLLAQQDQLIHDLRLMNERLGVASMTDALTRLANRRYFNEQLSKDWLRSRRGKTPISLLIIDIDFFKEYNDHYGHIKGDEALKSIADVLKDVVVRDTDLSARYGGDELAVILYSTDLVGAQWVAAQIIEEVQRKAIVHEKSPFKIMTASIGIASILPPQKSEQEMLLVQADNALYEAKANGRNNYSVYQ